MWFEVLGITRCLSLDIPPLWTTKPRTITHPFLAHYPRLTPLPSPAPSHDANDHLLRVAQEDGTLTHNPPTPPPEDEGTIVAIDALKEDLSETEVLLQATLDNLAMAKDRYETQKVRVDDLKDRVEATKKAADGETRAEDARYDAAAWLRKVGE